MFQFFYNHFFTAMFILTITVIICEFLFIMVLTFLLNLLLDSIDEKIKMKKRKIDYGKNENL